MKFSYIKCIKNWKTIGKELRRCIITDIVRNAIFILLGVGLYVLLENTGLLIYLILMIKYHWWLKERE